MRGIRLIETRRARNLRRTSTSAERILWRRLKDRGLAGFKFIRQAPIGPYIADFLCRETNLIIEIDGATHSTEEEIAGDRRRSAFLEDRGFIVIRFTNEAVYENAEGVLEIIRAKLQEPF